MKKYLIATILLLVVATVNADYLGIVERTTENSLPIPFVLLDSIGNPTSLADGDSVYVHVVGPDGSLVFDDSMAYNDASIDFSAWEDFAGGQIYTYTEDVSTLDGASTDEGIFTVKIWAQDLTSAALITPTTHTFQMVNLALTSVFDSILVALSDGSTADKAAIFADSILGHKDTAWGAATTGDQLFDLTDNIFDGALNLDNATGTIANSQVDDDVDVNVKTVTANAIGDGDIATDAIGANELNTDAVDEIWEYDVSNLSNKDGIGDSLISIGDTVIVNDRDVNVASMDANAIGDGDIAAGAIGATEIEDDAIDVATFAGAEPGAWWNEGKTGYTISADSYTPDVNVVSMDADAIEAGDIATGGIDADAIAVDAIGASEIAAAAITSSEMPTIAYFDTLIYGGAVWIDNSSANTNTVVGTDGIPTNPVSTVAAAKTVADALGYTKFYITNSTALTMAATTEEYEFIGIGAGNSVALNSVDVDGCTFRNLTISGTKGGTADILIIDGWINDLLLMDGVILHCGIDGDNSIADSDDLFMDNCYSMVAGNGTPSMAFGAGNCDLSNRHYSGGIEIKGMDVNDGCSIETDGQVIVNADCTAPDITVRGNATLTDNDGATDWTKDGVFSRQEADMWVWSNIDTTRQSDTSQIMLQLADRVWDEDTTGHKTDPNMGFWITQGGSATVDEEAIWDEISTRGITEADAGNSTTQLQTNLAEATNDHYNGGMLVMINGDEENQYRRITDYIGADGILVFTPALTAIPTDGDSIRIMPWGSVSAAGESKEDIADAVWDELITDHTTQNSMADVLYDSLDALVSSGGGSVTAQDMADISDSVWNHVDTAWRSASTGDQLTDLTDNILTTSDNIGINLDDVSGTLDAGEIGGDAITSAKIADDAIDVATFAGSEPGAWWNEGKTGYTISADSYTPDVNVVSVAANAIGDGDIATDAIGANELNTDAVTEIVGGVWSSSLDATLNSLKISNQTANDTGVVIRGNGTGTGLAIFGGVSSKAVHFKAGASSGGQGLLLEGGGTDGSWGFYASSQATNGNGGFFGGTGSGTGFRTDGGTTGIGTYLKGGSSSGVGFLVVSVSGDAAQFTAGGGNGDGIQASGDGSGHGLYGYSTATGSGIKGYATGTGGGMYLDAGSGSGLIIGGSTTYPAVDIDGGGPGIDIDGGSGNDNGIEIRGKGTGHGILAESGTGATGNGVQVTALSTNGNGIGLVATGTGVEMTYDDLVDGIWDEILATHTVNGSVGEVLLDSIDALVSSAGGGGGATASAIWDAVSIRGITEADGANSTTQLQTNLAEATNDHYNGAMFVLINGDEENQYRRITDYVGASGTVTITPALTAIPTDGDSIRVMPWGNVSASATVDNEAIWDEISIRGITEADAGNTTTQQQTNLTEVTDDHYNGAMFMLINGDEQHQYRRITDYVGATGTIVFTPALTATPTAGDSLRIMPFTEVDNGGTGPVTLTLKPYDTVATTFVEGAKVSVKNIATGTYLNPQTSNGSGVTTWGLYAGDFEFTSTMALYGFVTDTVTVAMTDITDTVRGEAITIPTSATSHVCAVSIKVIDGSGQPLPNIMVYANLLRGNLIDSAGMAVGNVSQNQSTNASGIVTFNCIASTWLLPETKWRFTVSQPSGVRFEYTVPDTSAILVNINDVR